MIIQYWMNRMIGSVCLGFSFEFVRSDPNRPDPNVTTLLFGSDRIRLKTFGSDESDNPIRSVYIPTFIYQQQLKEREMAYRQQLEGTGLVVEF